MFRLQEPLADREQQLLANLRQWMADQSALCVAYSGGVDSTLVAAMAYEAQGDAALAVTGVSPALAPHLLREARDQASWIGIPHRECATAELNDPDYSSNPVDRCFACKRELHQHLQPIAAAAGDALVIDGVNLDDLGDHRPGIEAARQAGVRSPLAELSIDKSTIRSLSTGPWFSLVGQTGAALPGLPFPLWRKHQRRAVEAGGSGGSLVDCQGIQLRSCALPRVGGTD